MGIRVSLVCQEVIGTAPMRQMMPCMLNTGITYGLVPMDIRRRVHLAAHMVTDMSTIQLNCKIMPNSEMHEELCISGGGRRLPK